MSEEKRKRGRLRKSPDATNSSIDDKHEVKVKEEPNSRSNSPQTSKSTPQQKTIIPDSVNDSKSVDNAGISALPKTGRDTKLKRKRLHMGDNSNSAGTTTNRASKRRLQKKRVEVDEDSDSALKVQKKCSRSTCQDTIPICFSGVTKRCSGSGYTSRWYHTSAGEHFCNDCFEYFYRPGKDGHGMWLAWKKKWSANAKKEPSVRTYLVDQYLPYWVQCNKETCRKWRQLPRETDLSSDFIAKYECGMNAQGYKKYANACAIDEDQRVQEVLKSSWIHQLTLTPYLKNSPAAEFLGAYYSDGVGLSPTCELNIKANRAYLDFRRNQGLKHGNNGDSSDDEHSSLRSLQADDVVYHPQIEGLNPNLQPFYQPSEQGKAFCMRPDVMEDYEKKEFREYEKEHVIYLAVRNLILALWNLNCRKWLAIETVTLYLICRGLVRIRFLYEAERILRCFTIRGIINIGLLTIPKHSLKNSEIEKDVIIIGAGPAGLGAARHLQNLGFKVVVLEARDRVGGRVDDTSMDGVSIGKGAQIITGVVNNPLTIICEQAEAPMRCIGEKCDLYNSAGLVTAADVDQKADYHFNALLDSVAEWRKTAKGVDAPLHDKLRDAQNSFIEGFSEEQSGLLEFHISNLEYACGSNLSDVSALYWDQNEHFPQFAGNHSLLPEGYATLISSLAEGLDIRFHKEVKKINYSADKLVINTTDDSFIASKAIVTVPLAVLQRNYIEFDPPLPDKKIKALSELGAGVIEKVALQFPVRFWDKKLQGADFFGYIPKNPSERGQFSVFYDMTPDFKKESKGPHILMTYVSGDAVSQTSHKTDDEIVSMCMTVLRNIFSEQHVTVPDPIQHFVTHWGQDRFSHMAYSYVKVGGDGNAYDFLAEDIEKKLFFAGEATNRHFPQTVTGAYLSGLREACKITTHSEGIISK